MKANMIKKPKLKHLSICVLAALAPQLAFAQDAEEKEVERISVLGSNIKVNHDTGALPVTAVSAEDIENTGAISGDELLSTIPQIGEVGFNSSRAIGGVNDARGDVSSINLRGIGTGYTLTLLNGRRLVLHPGTQSENLVPVTTVNSNTLPVRGLKRVEVLRDGAAAVYGSDAIAGVINYALKDDYEGSEVNLSYGDAEGIGYDQVNLSGATGFYLNDQKTHVSLSGGIYSRNGFQASERDYASNEDLRDFANVPEGFEGDSQLNNANTATPWGEFSSSTLGTFHLQPDTFSGCEDSDARGNPTTALNQAGVCVDRGSLPADQRYNRNGHRSLVSDVERFNFYALVTHEISEDLELFAEGLYYYAEADRVREQTGNLTSQRFTVRADAFYNPFGEDVTVRRYRPIDAGDRNIHVEDYSYRVLTGLRGYVDEWDWESAVLYSKANTLDSANRVRTSDFINAVNSTDQATAYDIFNGGDINSPNFGDTTVNDQSVIDSFIINVERESETELALWDFKLSTGSLYELPAGEVGFATGIEYRYESFFDIRSDVLNGSLPFVDTFGNNTPNPLASNVLGSSPTPDAEGSRNVFSAYAEFAVPLLEGLPLIERLDMQLAARYEDFSDVGDVLKPKVALSWIMSDVVQLRGSYAEGFRAPGLPQVVAENIARNNTRSDPIFDVRQGTQENRSGSSDLRPEESVNRSFGIVLQLTDNLTVTADWWNIEQQDVVGILNSQTQILFDALERSQGRTNPNVFRDENNEILFIQNDYRNLLAREVSGVDYSLTYDLDTNHGKFKFKLNGARLTQFDQEADEISQALLDAEAAGNTAIQFRGDFLAVPGVGSLIRQNGRPEWRITGGVDWRKEQLGAGARFRYVSSFEDTSTNATIDGENRLLPVDSWFTTDVYVNYSFDEGILDNTKITFGVRNLGDQEPPFADENFGFNASVHSARGRYFYLNVNKKF